MRCYRKFNYKIQLLVSFYAEFFLIGMFSNRHSYSAQVEW